MSPRLTEAPYPAINFYVFPESHWVELKRFAYEDEQDPKGCFRLADDTWRAWRYAAYARPTGSKLYSFRFGHLRSWLKLYVKRFCFLTLIGRGKPLTSSMAALPYKLSAADRHILERGHASLDDLGTAAAFEELWLSLLPDGGSGMSEAVRYTASDVKAQQVTRPFWRDLSNHFGSPQVVPPAARHKRSNFVAVGSDKSKVIPDAVIRQLANRLALHRDGILLMNPYDHLRLCVLMLVICLGRRIEEVLGARRGSGSNGPLVRYPCAHKEGGPKDAMWFRFQPNKGGVSALAYVSPGWEDIATYCVRQLITYGDEVREFAVPEEKDLLILISSWNLTTGRGFVRKVTPSSTPWDPTHKGSCGGKRNPRSKETQRRSAGLSYCGFGIWLNGQENSKTGQEEFTGIMREWKITADGSTDGPIYHLCTHYARHTRQSVLARDPKLPLLVRQRDLNHTVPSMQSAYQHVLDEENEELMEKMVQNPLLGYDLKALYELAGLNEANGEHKGSASYYEGAVSILTPRIRRLIESNPAYFEPNHVDVGYCEDPGGPNNCAPYKERSLPGRLIKGARRRVTGGQEVSRLADTLRMDEDPTNDRKEMTGAEKATETDSESPGDSKALIERLKKRYQEIESEGL